MNSKKIITIAILLTIVIVAIEYVLLFSPIPLMIKALSQRGNKLSGNILDITSPTRTFRGTIRALNDQILSVEFLVDAANTQYLKNGAPLILNVDASAASIQSITPSIPLRFSESRKERVNSQKLTDIHVGDQVSITLDTDLRLASDTRTLKAVRIMLSIKPTGMTGTVLESNGGTLTVRGIVPQEGNGTERTFTVHTGPGTEVSRDDVNTPLTPESVKPDMTIVVYCGDGIADTFTADSIQIIPATPSDPAV